MDGAGRANEPHAEPAEQHDQHRHQEEVADAAEHDQPRQDDEGNGVGDQVGPAAVQQRRRADAPQTAQRARSNPEVVKGPAEQQLIRELDGPGQPDKDRQDGDLQLGGAEQPAHVSEKSRRRGPSGQAARCSGTTLVVPAAGGCMVKREARRRSSWAVAASSCA